MTFAGTEAGEFALDHDELAIAREHEFALFDFHIADACVRRSEANGGAGEQVLHGVGKLFAKLVTPLGFQFLKLFARHDLANLAIGGDAQLEAAIMQANYLGQLCAWLTM